MSKRDEMAENYISWAKDIRLSVRPEREGPIRYDIKTHFKKGFDAAIEEVIKLLQKRDIMCMEMSAHEERKLVENEIKELKGPT